MTKNRHQTPAKADAKSKILRQLIASTVALTIMALGAWTLLGQHAPYHPAIDENQVSRGDASGAATAVRTD
jgi:hypothetical protein